jgi:hypothetical protein
MALFNHQPEDPAIHHAAARPARHLVALVEPCLPDPEAQERALTEFYSAIRLGLRELAREIHQDGKAR